MSADERRWADAVKAWSEALADMERNGPLVAPAPAPVGDAQEPPVEERPTPENLWERAGRNADDIVERATNYAGLLEYYGYDDLLGPEDGFVPPTARPETEVERNG